MTDAKRQPEPFRTGVIADDLTGALDTGAGFARAGLHVRLPLVSTDSAIDLTGIDVVVLNTATREGDATIARTRVAQATRTLLRSRVTMVYKKIDSALRGHPGSELAGVLDVLPPNTRALVAPAFPAQGRVTVDGVQYVHGRRPAAFDGSLKEAFAPVTERCDLRDASTDDDLHAIARAGVEDGARIWVGTAGLAAQIVPALIEAGLGIVGEEMPPTVGPWHEGRPVIVLAGSIHPATIAQVRALTTGTIRHLSIDPRDDSSWPDNETLDRHLIGTPDGVVVISTHHNVPDLPISPAWMADAVRLLAHIGAAIGRRLMHDPAPALVVTGGETAQQLFAQLRATAINVTGEALPGIPTGILHLPERSIPLVTKSGGFGDTEALIDVVRATHQ